MKCPTLGVQHLWKCPHPKRFSCQNWRLLTENLHQVALTKLPQGTTLVNPCKSPHPRQKWGFKLDVKSQGYGHVGCVNYPYFPIYVDRGSGNKTSALDLHVYAWRNSICSGVTWWISGFTRWQLFLSGMFSEVLPGGIVRCSGVTWWISGLTRWYSHFHAVLLINSIAYFIFGPHA